MVREIIIWQNDETIESVNKIDFHDILINKKNIVENIIL